MGRVPRSRFGRRSGRYVRYNLFSLGGEAAAQRKKDFHYHRSRNTVSPNHIPAIQNYILAIQNYILATPNSILATASSILAPVTSILATVDYILAPAINFAR